MTPARLATAWALFQGLLIEALPFLLIGFIPALANRLPRPGAWMETLKQALAFPMSLTGVWLLWVLGHQVGMDGAGAVLAGGVALAMALWWFERHRQNSRAQRWGCTAPRPSAAPTTPRATSKPGSSASSCRTTWATSSRAP